MVRIAALAFLVCTFLGCAVSGRAQVSRDEAPISVDIAVAKRRSSAIRLNVTIRNQSSVAKYITIGQDINAPKELFDLTFSDDGTVSVYSRLFEPDPDIICYGIVPPTFMLVRLEPDREYRLIADIKDGMTERKPSLDPNAPPDGRYHLRRLDISKLVRVRFDVGYFDEFDGIGDLLDGSAARSLDIFVRLRSGPYKAKPLYELQQIASGTVALR